MVSNVYEIINIAGNTNGISTSLKAKAHPELMKNVRTNIKEVSKANRDPLRIVIKVINAKMMKRTVPVTIGDIE